MRKMIVICLSIFIVYIIYQTSYKYNVNCLILSSHEVSYLKTINNLLSSKYHYVNINNQFINNNIHGMIDDIKKNKTIINNKKIYYLKKMLREADYLIIDIGMKELTGNYNSFNNSLNSLFFDKMYQDIQRLIEEIKKYAKYKIIFIGYYNPTNFYDSNSDKFFYNIDIRLNRLMMNNNIIYISTYELVKGNTDKEKDNYINPKGIKRLMELIDYYIN